MVHIPVLVKEVRQYLDPRSDQDFIDATVGEGGHSKMILERTAPKGRLLGIDRSARVLEETKKNLSVFSERAVLVQGNFSEIGELARRENFEKVDGILFDLGISLWHLEASDMGFSFGRDEELVMRFDAVKGERRYLTAGQIINKWPEKELTEIFRKYGEERYSQKIAREIVRQREKGEIKTSKQLADLISEIYPRKYSLKIHPATKVFQALRMTVNDEIGSLEKALPQALELLKSGGRIAVISFHSLEDRIVKQFFNREAKDCICPPHFLVCQCGHKASVKIITKKPIIAGEDEISANLGSRSAKLRVAEKL